MTAGQAYCEGCRAWVSPPHDCIGVALWRRRLRAQEMGITIPQLDGLIRGELVAVDNGRLM